MRIFDGYYVRELEYVEMLHRAGKGPCGGT